MNAESAEERSEFTSVSSIGNLQSSISNSLPRIDAEFRACLLLSPILRIKSAQIRGQLGELIGFKAVAGVPESPKLD